jgi:hypothetical protein
VSYIIIIIANLDIITSIDSLYHHSNPSSIFGFCRSGKKGKKKNFDVDMAWVAQAAAVAVLYRLF